jgi:hypothetical protein
VGKCPEQTGLQFVQDSHWNFAKNSLLTLRSWSYSQGIAITNTYLSPCSSYRCGTSKETGSTRLT